MAKRREERRSNAFGWQKLRLRGRILLHHAMGPAQAASPMRTSGSALLYMSSLSRSCLLHYSVGLDSIGSPSNGKSRETRKSNAFGWHKPRLRGRISTQACLVRRFTLSDKSSTGTQACPAASRYGTSASCITYADQWGCDPAL